MLGCRDPGYRYRVWPELPRRARWVCAREQVSHRAGLQSRSLHPERRRSHGGCGAEPTDHLLLSSMRQSMRKSLLLLVLLLGCGTPDPCARNPDICQDGGNGTCSGQCAALAPKEFDSLSLLWWGPEGMTPP